MRIGEVISMILKSNGITSLELATSLNMETETLDRILDGSILPKDSTLYGISIMLEVPLSMLHFMSMSEEEVPENKRDKFKELGEPLKEFIISIFTDNGHLK